MPSLVEIHLEGELAKAKAALETLVAKVANVYYAAAWSADREVDEATLWTELRDAAGFEPGNSPKPNDGTGGPPTPQDITGGPPTKAEPEKKPEDGTGGPPTPSEDGDSKVDPEAPKPEGKKVKAKSEPA